MALDILYETHSTTVDNERGVATGWLPVRLSPTGRLQAAALGARRRGWPDAVYTSDQSQAIQTALLAFAGAPVPMVHDPRLRECDYGNLSGSPAATLPRRDHVDIPFSHGESYRQVVARVADLLGELRRDWDGGRVLIIGHSATRWALDCLLAGADLAESVAAPTIWQPGWSYPCSS
jgi:broad specificity phosphatase PhoE